MKRNKRLLLKIAERIENIPQSYDQNTWRDRDSRSPCGAVACLAGEIVICSERTIEKGLVKLFEIGSVWSAAQDLAGLTDSEANNLFLDVEDWPSQFSRRYLGAKTQRGRANVAAALLRYLAAGGEA